MILPQVWHMVSWRHLILFMDCMCHSFPSFFTSSLEPLDIYQLVSIVLSSLLFKVLKGICLIWTWYFLMPSQAWNWTKISIFMTKLLLTFPYSFSQFLIFVMVCSLQNCITSFRHDTVIKFGWVLDMYLNFFMLV